ncbi:carbonic anhydrase-like [Saccostrea cucullata]|uniref:carbonic anhydrase-like n=1 Tax=Saccostrea cuccullata TaxID=36930 RepID=UPI002ED55271
MAKMSIYCFVALLLGNAPIINGAGHTWSYEEGSNGPSSWKSSYPICDEQAQSPIDLPPIATMTYDRKLVPFRLHDFDKPGSTYNLSMKNNGHTVKVDLEDNASVMVSGGGLVHSTYKVAQFHFHWGSNNTKGSEHTYNGMSYPMELHIVTYDSRYNNVNEAADKHAGLAVLGFFFEINDDANCNYSPLVEAMTNIEVYDGNSFKFPGFKLRHLMPMMFGQYFRYEGSLTTPPCFQSVQWTVFWQKIPISSAQMEKFRKLYTDSSKAHSLSNNYRPIQALNGRTIRTNVRLPETTSGSSSVFNNILSSILVLISVSKIWV